ncbi:hypothetical protein [Hyphomicrobium sp.]|jgi:hypothetical protein|uniref:hypothetical protein n=1 Tax=Hyphomicrobium sp. TaxID=82 RepID=UPI002FE32D05
MKAAILAVVVLAFSVSQASAVSHAVKMACAADYFAHCSMHAVGSPGVRKCMRAVGPRLSTRCIDALIAAGEVKTKVASKKTYKAKTYAAKTTVSKKKVAQKSSSKKHFAEKRASKKELAENRIPKKEHASKPSKKHYSKKQFTRLAEG